jgi:CarD family transcriptional regulator
MGCASGLGTTCSVHISIRRRWRPLAMPSDEIAGGTMMPQLSITPGRYPESADRAGDGRDREEWRVGRKVFYPGCGACFIASVAAQSVGDTVTLFYHLIVLDNTGEVFVPVEKARALGLRALLTRAMIPELLERLQRSEIANADWRQRARETQRLLASGSAFDLAELVTSLEALSRTHDLSVNERRALLRARALLIGEVSEVMGETQSAAEERIDRSLGASA